MDGVATPQEYIERAQAIGMDSVAITDHGTLSGHREFYRVAKAAGIKTKANVVAPTVAEMFPN